MSLDTLYLRDSNQVPMIFFGHSFGGIIAFELANLLFHRKQYNVAHLIISSTNNPQILTQTTLSETSKKFHQLSNEELLTELTAHGGIPVGLHSDILQLMYPIIRSDYFGLESYQLNSVDELQFTGFMTIFGSDEDCSNVTIESLNGWKDFCFDSNKFSIQFFHSQSHFYFTERHLIEMVLERIRTICEASSLISSSSPSSSVSS